MRKTLGILPSASLETVTMISSAHNLHMLGPSASPPRRPPRMPRMLYRVHMVTYVRRRYGDPYRALSRSFVDEPPSQQLFEKGRIKFNSQAKFSIHTSRSRWARRKEAALVPKGIALGQPWRSIPPRHGHQDRRADLLGAALEAAQELDGTCTIQLRGAAVATAERSSSALLRERAKFCALPALTRRARLMHAGWTWSRGALEGRGCAHRRARDRQ